MTKIRLIMIAVLLLGLMAGPAQAAETLREEKITDQLSPGLDHLISQAFSNNTETFDAAKIEKVLDFVAARKHESTLYYPEDKFNSTSVYYEFDMKSSMKKLLQYAYNQDLPSYVFNPSSIRVSYWLSVAAPENKMPHFSECLNKLNRPLVVKGTEYNEITPDLNSGAYYKYHDLRSLILMKYKGKNVFISVAKQKNISSPSIKAIALDDPNWNYIYTDNKGHTRFGLGWADSFIYDSCSIVIYYETDPHKPVLRCAVFKWINAGWKNMNLVKREHIIGGLSRYARDKKLMLESPSLPDIRELKNNYARINKLPLQALREKTGKYLTAIKDKYNDNEVISRNEFRYLFSGEKYLNQMTRPEMEALLIMDYIKNILGKKGILNNNFILDLAKTGG